MLAHIVSRYILKIQSRSPKQLPDINNHRPQKIKYPSHDLYSIDEKPRNHAQIHQLFDELRHIPSYGLFIFYYCLLTILDHSQSYFFCGSHSISHENRTIDTPVMFEIQPLLTRSSPTSSRVLKLIPPFWFIIRTQRSVFGPRVKSTP